MEIATLRIVNLIAFILFTVLSLKRVLLSAKALTTVQIDVRLRCDFSRYENKIFRHAENVDRRNRVIDRVTLQSDFYCFYGPVYVRKSNRSCLRRRAHGAG